MRTHVLALSAMIAAGSPFIAAPALAWSPGGCSEVPLPPWATTPGGKDYCRGVKSGGGSPVTVSQGQTQNQHQGQTQSASANNVNAVNTRLAQSVATSVSNVGNTTIHEGAQLDFVGTPDCGGVNVGVVGGYSGGLAAGIGASFHLGRTSDACRHYDEVAPVQPAPVVNVHVDAPAQPAPVVMAPAAPVVVYRTRVVHERRGCAHLTSGELEWYAHDLRSAKHTLNTRRIHDDRMMLESACRQDLVDRAIDG